MAQAMPVQAYGQPQYGQPQYGQPQMVVAQAGRVPAGAQQPGQGAFVRAPTLVTAWLTD
jgi:hypothetical protein